jgi:hypothetical protein
MDHEEYSIKRIEMMDNFISSCDRVNRRLVCAIIACVATVAISFTILGMYFTYNYFSYSSQQEVCQDETDQGSQTIQGY